MSIIKKKDKGNIENARATIKEKLIEKERELLCDEQQIFEFLSLYILCETACRDIMLESKKISNKQSKGSDCINISSIKAAVKKIGLESYNSDVLIESVFGGSDIYTKRYSKSCKKLRDGIVHYLNTNDIREVISRKEKLFADMTAFLNLVKQSAITENERENQYIKA